MPQRLPPAGSSTAGIAVHPGLVERPPPGARTCAYDFPHDGWSHIPLGSDDERKALLWASHRAGWWDGFAIVTWTTWFPDGGIFDEMTGVPDARGAMIATFAQFRGRRGRDVLAVLARVRGA